MKFARVHIIISISVSLLLFASCGQQYRAEKTVEAFVNQNAEDAASLKGIDFADIGTTRHISDSLIQVMRHRGAPLFKQGITYGQTPQGELFYLRMRFIHDGDTLQNTFYLNQELNEVVAFK